MTVTLFELMIAAAGIVVFGFLAGFILARRFLKADSICPVEHEKIKNDALSLKVQLDEKVKYIEKLEGKLVDECENTTRLGAEVAKQNEKISMLDVEMNDKKKEVESLYAKFNEEFSKIANQVLVKNSGEFSKQTVERLKDVLSPFKDQIDKFEKKIDDSRSRQIEESTSLKSQISQLTSLNTAMSEEARNLTRALKNESKTRGDWGEMILEKILSSSGLVKDDHYTMQKTLKDDENARLKPDVIIHLPEERHIIIDSKVSLVDYERYCSAGEGEGRTGFLESHVASLYRHVDNLGSKEYQKALGVNPPDFVLMFVPIESALAVALEHDRDLFGYAWKKNIALISPTMLIPTMKIIYNIWRQESQNRNALAIAEMGGKLYDKFVGFLNDLALVGKSIDGAKGSYEEAMKKLSTGRGNAIGMTQKMKELGAKAGKQLPAELDYEEN